MNIEELKYIKWNGETYKEFQKLLKKLGEEKYVKFNARLIPDMGDTYGVRIPMLRKLANNIGKADDLESIYKFLNDGKTHDEKLIQGMIIVKFKNESLEEKISRIDSYILRINNWALCDSFVSNLRPLVNKNKDKFSNKVKDYIKSENPWKIRFGLILLNSYYTDAEHLDYIFSVISKIESEHYYVKMGIAWLVSTCYIVDKVKVVEFIKSGKMDKWCRNKSIQKIVESTRVSKEEKEEIKKLKI